MKFKTDKLTSIRMSHVPHTKTEIENIIAKRLWRDGFRYRRNYRKLPGAPDIVITKYKIAVFADGELWHGYNWVNAQKHIKRNRDYWIPKIEKNMKRDKQVNAKLEQQGWTVLRFWGHTIKKYPDYCVAVIEYYAKWKGNLQS